MDTDRLRAWNLYGRRSRTKPLFEMAVVQYAKELARLVEAKLAESAAVSQSLDRTFPARLVQRGPITNLSDWDIRNKLSMLEDTRSRLKSTGLLDKDDTIPFQVPTAALDEQTRQVLAVYADDVEKKLSVFNDVVEKLELFQRLVNSRFRYKHMSFDREQGFILTGYDETRLTPADLSSGEQHELVLLYYLLFKVSPHSLILIDEPELSLHVVWQQEFLRDLAAIIALSPFDVLIATHSPQIIYDRWDLTEELSGPPYLNHRQ